MEQYQIYGGRPLRGEVKASGAKNAISKMLIASLICDKKCLFTNVPHIVEVQATIELCKEIGAEVHWDQKGGILEVVTPEIKSSYVPLHFSGSNRMPILLLGALLGRYRGHITIPTLGGCEIGKRPVDFHIAALEKLGATVEYHYSKNEAFYLAHAKNGLEGAIVELPYPSVMATENTILAACRAKGRTVLRNAAMEPEIIDLILFLQKLGVIIKVDVDRTIYVHETTLFYEVEHRVITDRIEAACYGMAAISTKGRVFVHGAEQLHMISFLNTLRMIGGGFSVKETGIEFFYQGPLQGGLHLETDVHPGFLTDWQQPFVVLLTQAFGTSVIHETVYENRFGYIKTLKKLGADVELFTQCLGGRTCRFASRNYEHSLIIKGPTTFSAAEITVPDLRAGFAYVMAALLVPDKTILRGLPFLDRGYENLDQKLQSLGAEIQRIKELSPTPLFSPVGSEETVPSCTVL